MAALNPGAAFGVVIFKTAGMKEGRRQLFVPLALRSKGFFACSFDQKRGGELR
jgi:hypothetical protein